MRAAFEEGLFVAMLMDEKFNTVGMDYIIETTANKSFKGSGDIIGLTLKGPQLVQWFLARPVTAVYSSNFQKMLIHKKKLNSDEDEGTDTNKAEIKRWNTHVEK